MNYDTGGIFGKKILVLGEAHLCKGCEDYCHVDSQYDYN